MASEETVNEPTVTYGTSDVFHDLGLPDADDLLAKSKLAIAIKTTIEEMGLTQTEAAARIGVDQAKISKIVRGRLSEFSTDRMVNYLLRLGLNVDLVIHNEAPKSTGHGTLNIIAYQ